MVSITVAVPPLVSLIGLILWHVTPDTKPKIAETGKWMFIVGLLATLLLFDGLGAHAR